MRTEKIAKFKELALTLKDQVEQGKYLPNSLIPSEPQLQEMYQVSRTTVREAIDLLVQDGYLRKKRGRWSGTYVLERKNEISKLRKGLNFGTLGNKTIIDSSRSDIPIVSQSIIEELEKWEGSLSLFPFLAESHPEQLMYVKKIIDRNLVDGFFLWGSSDIKQLSEYLLSINFPFVYVNTMQHEIFKTIECPNISIDELETITDTLKNHRNNGVSKIVLIAGSYDLLPGRTDDLLRTAAGCLNMNYRCLNSDKRQFMKILEEVKTFSAPDTLLVTSNELLESVDNALTFHKLRVPKDVKVFLFKHFSPDWEFWEGKYPIFERPYEKLGKQAVQMIGKILTRRETGLPPLRNWSIKLNSYCIHEN